MTKREFTGKGGETWEWEETPETIEALKKLHATERLHDTIRKKKKKAPDYGVGK